MDAESTKEIIYLLKEIRDILKTPKTDPPKIKKSTALRVNGKTTLIRTPDFEQNTPFQL